MKGFNPTPEQIAAHQRRHGFQETLKQASAELRMPVVTSEALKGAPLPEKGVKSRGGPGKRRKEMNQTEKAFAQWLNTQVDTGDIEGWYYEQITLRWGELDNIQYTPDFTVHVDSMKGVKFSEDGTPQQTPANYIHLIFVEVKGAHIWPKDIEKFKAARNQFPFYEFQLWQKKKNRLWKQLY